jgi:hypothetical protein
MARFSDNPDGAIYGGCDKRGTQPHFDVDDINAGIARVKGSAVRPASMPSSMGWFSMCTIGDATAGLWQTDESACRRGVAPALPPVHVLGGTSALVPVRERGLRRLDGVALYRG